MGNRIIPKLQTVNHYWIFLFSPEDGYKTYFYLHFSKLLLISSKMIQDIALLLMLLLLINLFSLSTFISWQEKLEKAYLKGSKPLPPITAKVSPLTTNSTVYPVTCRATVATQKLSSVRTANSSVNVQTHYLRVCTKVHEREGERERDLWHNKQHSPSTSSWANSYSKR